MSGTKSQREMRAASLLEDLRLMSVTAERVAAVCDFEAEQYQRGFLEGYELGKEPDAPAPTPKEPRKLNAVRTNEKPKAKP